LLPAGAVAVTSGDDMWFRCGICGSEFEYREEHYSVMIQEAHGGLTESLRVCGACLATPLSDVLEATRRKQEAEQFAVQADREVQELTKNPDGCAQRVKTGTWPNKLERYCSRKAVRDGYCLQHLWTHGLLRGGAR